MNKFHTQSRHSRTARIVAPLCSAALLFCSLPPNGIGLLGFIAFLPLCYILEDTSARQSVFPSFLWSVAFFPFFLSWALNYGWVIYLLLCVVGLLGFMVVFFVGARLEQKVGPFMSVLVVPSLWILVGYTYHRIFFVPFSISANLARTPAAIQYISIFGPLSVDFIQLLFARSISKIIFYKLAQNRQECQMPNRLLLFPLLVFALTLTSGIWYYWGPLPKSAHTPIKVAIIQGNTSKTTLELANKGESLARQENLRNYYYLTHGVAVHHPDLILWPETTLPTGFFGRIDLQRILKVALENSNSFLLSGIPYDDGSKGLYNSAILFNQSVQEVGRYDKQRLTPAELNDFVAGTGIGNLQFGESKLGMLICFESLFPSMAQKRIIDGAQYLVILSNDTGFDNTREPSLHAAHTILRSIENRRYTLSVSNNGVSMAVDPKGRILVEVPTKQRGYSIVKVSPINQRSIYSYVGNLLPFASFCFLLIITVIPICKVSSLQRSASKNK